MDDIVNSFLTGFNFGLLLYLIYYIVKLRSNLQKIANDVTNSFRVIVGQANKLQQRVKNVEISTFVETQRKSDK